jgi:E3 ubiquitin-protein ligase BRE1
MTSVATQQLEDLQKELEEYRELANNRLQELDKLHQEHRECLKEVEKLKMDIRQLPESVIVETTEYKCLQSQYSVLYNEYMQIKNLLEETRNHLQNSKTLHLRQIEIMEGKELAEQKRSRNDLIKMEDLLEKIQKEYDMLRIEYEQNLAANEQTAPINREMRHLITSLQNHNTQLKGEVNRHKRKYKEVSGDNVKLRKELEEMSAKMSSQQQARNAQESEVKQENPIVKEEETCEGTNPVKDEPGTAGPKSEPEDNEGDGDSKQTVKTEKTGELAGVKKEGTPTAGTSNVKQEKDVKEEQKQLKYDSDVVRDLRNQLKKALNDQKEMKLLLDMYKGVSKEQRDKVQLMACEKKIRAELEELRNQMKKMQESKREDRKKLADEEAQRKIKQLTEQLELQKQAVIQKQPDGQGWGYRPFVGSNVSFFEIQQLLYFSQTFFQQEEEALLNEMEVTGLAYEEMQEQNSRLLQQLKEKDDANFKLMSDRIKSNQLHKLLREEKQVLEEQVSLLISFCSVGTIDDSLFFRFSPSKQR